jgi:hypothetical protein
MLRLTSGTRSAALVAVLGVIVALNMALEGVTAPQKKKASAAATLKTSKKVTISSANLPGNSIVTTLGGNESGPFKLEIIADDGTVTQIYSTTSRTGRPAPYPDSFPVTAATPKKTFTKVRATWAVGGVNEVAEFAYRFKNLGLVHHTQYNIPTESDATCNRGAMVNVWIKQLNPGCDYAVGRLREVFEDQLHLNGSGRSISYGNLKMEFYCVTPPRDRNRHKYRRGEQFAGGCGGAAALNNNTVAVLRNNTLPLACGDRICIIGAVNSTNVVKTVTDYCPACNNDQYQSQSIPHIDNFTATSGACTGIPDLGNGYYVTVKL